MNPQADNPVSNIIFCGRDILINNSVIIQGINNTGTNNMGCLTVEELELLRIFNLLNIKERYKLLDTAFSFEKNQRIV